MASDTLSEAPTAQHDPVKTAARTLDVFEVFAKARVPLTLTELAARLGSPISSCHALVRTLQARGYVYILDARKLVYPTKRLLAVARQIAQNDPILGRIGPVLDTLMQQTGETIILGKRQGDAVTYLDVIEGRHTIRYAASPGDTKPLHSSAIGKAMLGVLTDADLSRLLAKLPLSRVTGNTLTTRDEVMDDIAAGRAHGFFITRGENVPDVMAISIARTVGDEPYGVAIAGPVGRLEAGRDALVAALLDAGEALQRIDADLRGPF
jgi:DNA-binding IclR family transcriptional regulator